MKFQNRTFAFNPRLLENVRIHIDHAGDRLHNTHHLVLTEDDMVELFIAPEHREPLALASRLFPSNGNRHVSFNWRHERMEANVSMSSARRNNQSMMFPDYASKQGIREDADPQLAQRVQAYVIARWLTARRLGAAYDLVSWLNARTANPAAVRILLPSLLPFLRSAPEHTGYGDKCLKLADTLDKAKGDGGDWPEIHPACAEVMEDTKRLFMQLVITKDIKHEKAEAEVDISVHHYGRVTRAWPTRTGKWPIASMLY